MLIIGPIGLLIILWIIISIATRGDKDKKMRMEFESYASRYERENGKPLSYSFAEFWQFATAYLKKARMMNSLIGVAALLPVVFLALAANAGTGYRASGGDAVMYLVLAGITLVGAVLLTMNVSRKFKIKKFPGLVEMFEKQL